MTPIWGWMSRTWIAIVACITATLMLAGYMINTNIPPVVLKIRGYKRVCSLYFAIDPYALCRMIHDFFRKRKLASHIILSMWS